MKSRSSYACTNCGAMAPSWIGKCPECGEWNTYVEQAAAAEEKKGTKKTKGSVAAVQDLAGSTEDFERMGTGIGEVDLVFGGGITVGSLALLSGEPGIGKSTLTLQLCDALTKAGKKVLYIAGEESPAQIANRAKRLGAGTGIRVVTETDVADIVATAEAEQPDLLVIDSIQVVSSGDVSGVAGSVLQVRNAAETFMRVAKEHGITTLLIGHVTKDGTLAGPRVLEHLVDTVLFLEGERTNPVRVLKATKNRFGPTDETGVFTMAEEGLKEAIDPAETFTESHVPTVGSCLMAISEGSRTFFVEVQALVTPAKFGYPKRTVSGIDINRLNIILAVLSRHAGIHLDGFDVFVSTVGDFQTDDRGADLAIALALASSKSQKPLPKKVVAIGEVGLTGMVRAVGGMERRLKDAKKLGLGPLFDGKKAKGLKEVLGEAF